MKVGAPGRPIGNKLKTVQIELSLEAAQAALSKVERYNLLQDNDN